MKKEYDVFTALINNSGLGWNDDAKLPTAPDHVWDTYCAHTKRQPNSGMRLCRITSSFVSCVKVFRQQELELLPWAVSRAKRPGMRLSNRKSTPPCTRLWYQQLRLLQLHRIQTAETETESSPGSLRAAVLKMHWRTVQMLKIILSVRQVPRKN